MNRIYVHCPKTMVFPHIELCVTLVCIDYVQTTLFVTIHLSFQMDAAVLLSFKSIKGQKHNIHRTAAMAGGTFLKSWVGFACVRLNVKA